MNSELRAAYNLSIFVAKLLSISLYRSSHHAVFVMESIRSAVAEETEQVEQFEKCEDFFYINPFFIILYHILRGVRKTYKKIKIIKPKISLIPLNKTSNFEIPNI